MSHRHRPTRLLPLCGPALAIILMAGCGDKDTNVPPETPAATPAASAPAAPASPMAAPVYETGVDARLKEAEAAMQAQNYDKATDTLLALQQQPKQLNAQQAGKLSALMRQLQSQLAGALAGGDARAQSAADKLRRAATAR